MKKRIWHLSRCVVVCATFLFVQQFVQSQVSNPSTWESFVQNNANISIQDTFRMQTSEELASDSWNCAITGEALIEDTSGVEDIPNSHGSYGLRMPTNIQVTFEHFTLTDHQDIKISIRKGGILLVEGEGMRARAYRGGETSYPSLVSAIGESGINPFKTTGVKNSPPGLDLIVPTPAVNTENGYYYVDSVCARGMIPTYSLFTGNSDWGHEDRWSHLPAYRHHNALINDNTSVNTNIGCKDIFIGNRNIHILPTGNLSANNFTIYPNDGILVSSSALRSSGAINISGEITIEKTFTQEGKWYFISFPFDIFASGIDPDFQLGDDKSDTNGNYFYVQTHNGEKQTNSQSLSNDWEVIPQTVINTSQPIFKKNEGYLTTTNAFADRQNLCFSSEVKDIPIDFGKNGQASIPVSINNQDQNQNHNGWYLCGNPLPAPLLLSQIKSNSALDGYIYIYDDSTYQPYVIDSNFAIPPFSVFFVKANGGTNLSVYNTSETVNYKLLSTNAPTSFPTSEPQARQDPPISNQAFSFPELGHQLENKTLFINNLSSPGKARLLTPTGILVFTQVVQAGNPILSIPLPQGLYILIIQTEHYRAQYKCVLTS